MNSSSFNSISELNEYKRNLKLSFEALFTQYCQKIHSNLLQREEINLDKSFYHRKLTNDFGNMTMKKPFLQNKVSFHKLNSDKGISLKTFLEYINIQDFLGERLFKYFNKSKSNTLNKSEFTNGLNNIYYSDIPELIKLTFFLADFNDDGKVYKSDMKLILVYIPSSSELLQKIKIKQINKIINTFFDEKIKAPMIEEEKDIDLETYTKYINEYKEKENSNDNINGNLVNDFNNNAPFFYFISILSYLFFNCPFTIKNINYIAPPNKKLKLILRNSDPKGANVKNLLMTTIKKGQSMEVGKEMIGLMTNFGEKNKYKIEAIPKIGQKNLFQKQPKRSTSQKTIISNNTFKLNKALNNAKENIKERDFIIAKPKEEIKYNKIKKEVNMFKKKISNNKNCFSPNKRNIINDFSRSPELNSIFNKNSTNEESLNNSKKNIYNGSQNKKFALKPKLPAIAKEKLTPLSVGFHLKKRDSNFKEPSEFMLCDLSESDDGQKNLFFVDEEKKNELTAVYCYKVTEESNNFMDPKIINKFYAVLSEKELLFFTNESKNDLCDLWYIYKTHITIGKESINNTQYFTLNINFFNNNAVNKLYFTKEIDCQNFAKKIKKSIHDLSFNDFYELGEVLGQGHFAKVCKCKHKTSNKLFAVKIITKADLKPKDLELIHQERSYLNLIKHPNIIGLKDYYEDKKSIYLVTEFCSGGDLITFIEKNPQITEKTAAKIIHKIAEGIKYLNIFGIVHRDIKPENILFNEENDIKSLKIIDLGICKTLTYGQMESNPVGTNGYISPEIYLHKEYNFKTDIWSLGIILYCLITQGILPFDHENMDNKVIGKKVIYLQQEYPEEYFGKCSKSLTILLDKMLDKNFEKRIDINNLLKDSWFNIIKKQG